jgi:excisionase family DNA binding protein
MTTQRLLRLPVAPPEGRAPEQLYRISEAAAFLCLSRRTVFTLLKQGELDAVGEGRLTRIPASAIAAYQQRHRRSNRAS